MRDGAAAARVAHNHEVPGSSPGPATKKKRSLRWSFFLAVEPCYSKGMQINKRRLVASLTGSVLGLGLYRLYLYTNNREQLNDSNLLVAAVFVGILSVLIYVALSGIASFRK